MEGLWRCCYSDVCDSLILLSDINRGVVADEKLVSFYAVPQLLKPESLSELVGNWFKSVIPNYGDIRLRCGGVNLNNETYFFMVYSELQPGLVKYTYKDGGYSYMQVRRSGNYDIDHNFTFFAALGVPYDPYER